MATAKKATPKQSSARKSTVKHSTKTASVKKAAPKKKTPNTKVKKKSAQERTVHSFKISQDTQPFRNFTITRQTIYWIILVAFIIFAQLWILKLQIEVASLIEAQQAQLMSF